MLHLRSVFTFPALDANPPVDGIRANVMQLWRQRNLQERVLLLPHPDVPPQQLHRATVAMVQADPVAPADRARQLTQPSLVRRHRYNQRDGDVVAAHADC